MKRILIVLIIIGLILVTGCNKNTLDPEKIKQMDYNELNPEQKAIYEDDPPDDASVLTYKNRTG